MTRVDPEVNMNRFYCVQLTKSLFGEFGVERRWGRSGARGRLRLDWYASLSEAKEAMSKLIKQKLKKGYTGETELACWSCSG